MLLASRVGSGPPSRSSTALVEAWSAPARVAAVTALSVFEGMSFVRDFPRNMENGEPLSIDEVKKDGKTFYVIGLSPSAMLDAFAIPKPVESVGSGPAVNLDGIQ